MSNETLHYVHGYYTAEELLDMATCTLPNKEQYVRQQLAKRAHIQEATDVHEQDQSAH